jgi:hypothetical protein
MKGKAEMGATIIHRVGPALVPDDADAVIADLGEELPLLLELIDTACVHPVGH